jgi:hypothetical protein
VILADFGISDVPPRTVPSGLIRRTEAFLERNEQARKMVAREVELAEAARALGYNRDDPAAQAERARFMTAIIRTPAKR